MTSDRHRPEVSPFPTAVVIWLVVQTATLAVIAMRIPLWARAGGESQRLGFTQMIVVQIAGLALLFPMQLRGRHGITIACCCLPFLTLAARLSFTPTTALLAASAQVLLWALGLATWAATLRRALPCLFARLLASAVAIACPLMGYLFDEFTGRQNLLAPFSPTTAALEQAFRPNLTWIVLGLPSLCFAFGLGTFLLRVRKSGFATTYPQSNPQSTH